MKRVRNTIAGCLLALALTGCGKMELEDYSNSFVTMKVNADFTIDDKMAEDSRMLSIAMNDDPNSGVIVQYIPFIDVDEKTTLSTYLDQMRSNLTIDSIEYKTLKSGEYPCCYCTCNITDNVGNEALGYLKVINCGSNGGIVVIATIDDDSNDKVKTAISDIAKSVSVSPSLENYLLTQEDGNTETTK